jgi:hypothetical protein
LLSMSMHCYTLWSRSILEKVVALVCVLDELLVRETLTYDAGFIIHVCRPYLMCVEVTKFSSKMSPYPHDLRIRSGVSKTPCFQVDVTTTSSLAKALSSHPHALSCDSWPWRRHRRRRFGSMRRTKEKSSCQEKKRILCCAAHEQLHTSVLF